MCFQSISILFSSGEYGGKNNNCNPSFSHFSISALKSLLVCIDALSTYLKLMS
jgi:hypothetical protein